MDLNRMIEAFKKHPGYPQMGMIASHLGVVRGTSLNGQEVTGIEVTFDDNVIGTIVNDIKKMPGIIEVLVEAYGGLLKVGEDVMVVAVGGDTREHVFPALVTAVNRIKEEATRKKEFFVTL